MRGKARWRQLVDPLRVVELVVWFVRWTFAAPSSATGRLRLVASKLLDLQFDDRSCLPFLPEAKLGAILSHEVCLPPQAELEPGNQALIGLIFLVSLAKALGARQIFEIGTYNGVTALTLAANVPACTIHTLDLPPGQRPQLHINVEDEGNIVEFPQRAYVDRAEAARISQHFGDSASFDFHPFYSKCDMIYVDGAHSYDYVALDTENAMSMASDISAVVWDDYWRRVPDVARYLHSRTDLKLYRVPNTRLVIRLSDGAIQRLSLPGR